MVARFVNAVNYRAPVRRDNYTDGRSFVVISVDYNNDGIAKITRCLILLP